jgi:hypothetical protein
MPLLRDVNGFSQLLELFPLVTAIKATHAHLVMPSRDSAGQRPTTAEATLYVTVSLNQAHTGPAWQCHVVDLRFLPHCEVIYDVDLDNDDIDYSTALWDECLLSFPGSTNTVSAAPTPVWIDEESGIKISLHAILRRSIRSLVCRESATLLVLADHMRCRKRLGFTDIERIAVIDNTSDGDIPTFLRQFPNLTHFSHLDLARGWNEHQASYRYLTTLLLMDWTRPVNAPITALRHLEMDIDLWYGSHEDTEDLLDDKLQARAFASSFASLETLTLLVRSSADRNSDCMVESGTSVPRYSQIAKALVQIGGTHFKLIITFDRPQWPDDGVGEEGVMQTMMRSQLVKAVRHRQKKERQNPKLSLPSPF